MSILPRQTVAAALGMVLLACLAPALSVPGEVISRDRATRVYEREQEVAGTIPKPIKGLTPLLSPAEAHEAESLLVTPAVLLSWRPVEAPAPIPGLPRFQMTAAPDFAIEVVEDDWLKCSTASFANAISYLRASAALARNNRAVPGPLHCGVAAMASYHVWYVSDKPWSHMAKEGTAAYYLLKALNKVETTGADDPLAALRSFFGGSPAVEPCDLRPTKEEVLPLLQRLYMEWPDSTSRVTQAMDSLMNGPQPPRPPVKGHTPGPVVSEPSIPREFQVKELLVPRVRTGESHQDAVPPEYCRAMAASIVETVNAHPKQFPHLPTTFRLLRVCREVAAEREPIAAARGQMGLPTAEGEDARAIARRLESLCKTWRSWLDDEVKIRRKQGPPARVGAEVQWDPHAVAELVALLMENSVAYARRVSVPCAEDPKSLPAETMPKVMEDAFREDKVLLGVLDTYGWPEITTVPWASAPEDGMTVRLTWTVKCPDNVTDYIVLQMEQSLSHGGSGLPIEPGLTVDQSLPVCRPSISAPPRSLTLADLKEGDFAEVIVDLVAGEAPPPGGRRWHQVAKVKSFAGPPAVRLMMGENGALEGTASQEVWAKLASRGGTRWDWHTLEDLMPGDVVYHMQRGPCAITGRSRERPADGYAQLALAGADHTHVNGFVVRCKRREIVDDSRHGLLEETVVLLDEGAAGRKTEEIGKIKANLGTREFAPCLGYSTQTAKIRCRKDQLIDVAKDQTQVLFRIAYVLDGRRVSIGTAHSHGFWVRRADKAQEVAAHEIVPGDLLLRDEKGSPPAEVIAVSMEPSPEGKVWPLYHPRLLRCEWIQANGVLVHTAQRPIDVPGVVPGTHITLAAPAPDSTGGWHVGLEVPIEGLKAPVAGPLDEKNRFHLLLTCWPDGPLSPAGLVAFMPQAISELRSGVTGDLVHVETEKGHILNCGPATSLWRKIGEGTGGRVFVKPVFARMLEPGDQIVVLGPEGGNPSLALDKVVSAEIDENLELTSKGYSDVLLPRFLRSEDENLAAFQDHYSNVFASRILVRLGVRAEEEKDIWVDGTGTGTDVGTVTGARAGMTIGPHGMGFPDPKQRPAVTYHGTLVEPKGDEFRFDDGDKRQFEMTLKRLEAAMAEFGTKHPELPTDAGRLARFQRFAAACLPPGDWAMESVLSMERLSGSVRVYCGYRGLLMGTGHPQALEAMVRIGVPLSYMLHEAGGREVAEALLNDLLTVEMRLALRARTGKNLWNYPGLPIRDSVRYAIEFWQLDVPAGRPPDKNHPAAARFWNSARAGHTWDDLLEHRVEDGEINRDVFTVTDKGDQQVLLWNLVLQMDYLTGNSRVLDGFITRGFVPGAEFEGEIGKVFAPAPRPGAVGVGPR